MRNQRTPKSEELPKVCFFPRRSSFGPQALPEKERRDTWRVVCDHICVPGLCTPGAQGESTCVCWLTDTSPLDRGCVCMHTCSNQPTRHFPQSGGHESPSVRGPWNLRLSLGLSLLCYLVSRDKPGQEAASWGGRGTEAAAPSNLKSH
jgi:hypothetical protein